MDNYDFKKIVDLTEEYFNEIEDIVYGDASINQFMYHDSIYMKNEQFN